MQRRIERAKELLLDRSVELAEIAVACGFVDQSHLTRAFTKSEGYSPGKWRRLRAARPSPPQAEARYLRAEPPARSAAGPVL
jgi:transcriptional regulator GlxA family with amidase domain